MEDTCRNCENYNASYSFCKKEGKEIAWCIPKRRDQCNNWTKQVSS